MVEVAHQRFMTLTLQNCDLLSQEYSGFVDETREIAEEYHDLDLANSCPAVPDSETPVGVPVDDGEEDPITSSATESIAQQTRSPHIALSFASYATSATTISADTTLIAANVTSPALACEPYQSPQLVQDSRPTLVERRHSRILEQLLKDRKSVV